MVGDGYGLFFAPPCTRIGTDADPVLVGLLIVPLGAEIPAGHGPLHVQVSMTLDLLEWQQSTESGRKSIPCSICGIPPASGRYPCSQLFVWGCPWWSAFILAPWASP